jgi:ribosomal protein S8
MSDAIETFLAAYKKTSWKSLEEASKYKNPDTLYQISGNQGAKIGKEINGIISIMKAYKKTIGGSFDKLCKAALALHKTAKAAVVMFKDEKYPKASAAAVEIAADAMFFSGNVNPASLERFLDDCIENLVNEVNRKLKQLIDGTGNLQAVVLTQTKTLQQITNIGTAEGRAESYNKLSADDIARKVTTQLGQRIKAATALSPALYPVAKAQAVLDALTPYANSRKRETADSITKTLVTIAKLYNQARQLPNYPEEFTAP